MTKEEYDLIFPTEEMKHQMTLDALASVDAGRVISHEAVSAWAKSLGTDNPLPLPQPQMVNTSGLGENEKQPKN